MKKTTAELYAGKHFDPEIGTTFQCGECLPTYADPGSLTKNAATSEEHACDNCCAVLVTEGGNA